MSDELLTENAVFGVSDRDPDKALAILEMCKLRLAGFTFVLDPSGGIRIRAMGGRELGELRVSGLIEEDIFQALRIGRAAIIERLQAEAADPDFDQQFAARAVRAALAEGMGLVVTIEGGAGQGKSWVATQIIKELREQGAPFFDAAEYKALMKKGLSDEAAELKNGTIAVLGPTWKAASVLMLRGVPEATTLHSAIYAPVWKDSRVELQDWLKGPLVFEDDDELIKNPLPELVTAWPRHLIERVHRAYQEDGWQAALDAADIDELRDLLSGWTTKDCAFRAVIVDEASMITREQLADLQASAEIVVLVGDPLQLPPVVEFRDRGNPMKAQALPTIDPRFRFPLSRVRRQGEGSGILKVAYGALNPCLNDIEDVIALADGVDVRLCDGFAGAVIADGSPALCWTNRTRITVSRAWRKWMGYSAKGLERGEVLICKGTAEKAKLSDGRLMQDVGLFNNTFWTVERVLDRWTLDLQNDEGDIITGVRAWVGDPPRDVAKAGLPDAEPLSRGGGGAFFRSAAAVTTHSAQGGQFGEVQVSLDDMRACAASGLFEAGRELWRSMLYVAATRAESKLWLCSRGGIR